MNRFSHKNLPECGSLCCFLLTGACQTRNSGFGMCESDSRHDPVAHRSEHITTEGRSMDHSLVQAKTSRSRSNIASDIGNGMMKLATCGTLHAADQRRLPARVRYGCFRIRYVEFGIPDPVSRHCVWHPCETLRVRERRVRHLTEVTGRRPVPLQQRVFLQSRFLSTDQQAN